MVKLQFEDKQLNYFKFASIVVNEFPKALRYTFKLMRDTKYGPGQPWDDSVAVRKSFRVKEGGKTKVPTYKSYDEWDCTALFQATIHAQSFALPDNKGHLKTLSEMYIKPHGLPHGRFHTSVVSPSGNNTETVSLAIHQLRLLRNWLCHFTSSEIDRVMFDQCVQLAKDALKALGVKTGPVDDLGSLKESHFPTNEVAMLERKNRIMQFALFY